MVDFSSATNINIFMESLGTGTTLEALLQESRQHTVLLSDLRENSEVRRKTDEKTLSQLKKLQQATSQTLEVAKAHKQQNKETSTTLKAINEATVNTNAINTKRQTSALNTLSKTIDVGFNVVNQKMFSLIEKLGSKLAGAFASVGRSLENKLYNLTGSLSIVLKPLVSIVKLGFNIITKLVAVPLKMLWEGFKVFNKTLIGKITTTVVGVYLMYKFLTSTGFGKIISNALNNYREKHKGGFVDKAMTIGSFIGENPIKTLAALIAARIFGPKLITKMLTKGGGALIKTIGGALKTIGGAQKNKVPTLLNRGKTSAAKVSGNYISKMNKQELAQYIAKHGGPDYISNGKLKNTKKDVLYNQAKALKRTSAAKVANTAGKASKFGKLATVGKFVGGKGNIAAMLAGAGLDIAADHVENKTASGLLNVGSAALGGAATGAMIGSIIPGIGTGIGAAIGGLIGAGGSLLAGEGGQKLFGSNGEQTEMDTLANLQEQQAQSANAQIHSLEDIAESIRESNKTLTRVVEMTSNDAQQDIKRREANSTEQARHNEAVEQMKLTRNSNELLQDILQALQQLTNGFVVKNVSNGNDTSHFIAGMS